MFDSATITISTPTINVCLNGMKFRNFIFYLHPEASQRQPTCSFMSQISVTIFGMTEQEGPEGKSEIDRMAG